MNAQTIDTTRLGTVRPKTVYTVQARTPIPGLRWLVVLLTRLAARLKGDAQALCLVAADLMRRDAWTAEAHNLVVNAGLDDLLDKYFRGAAYTAAHYVGLTDSTPTVAAGDTMASHAGWVEIQTYSQATRPAFTPGAVSGQSVDNSASRASYSINGAATIGGLFLTTSDVKGGTAGILYGVAAFNGGDRTLADGDTLQVTATATTAAV